MAFKDIKKTITKSLSLLIGVKRNFIFAIFLCVLISMLEIINVGLIFPFFSLIINPDIIITNSYTKYLYKLFNFSTTKEFILIAGVAVLLIIVILNYLIYFKTKFMTRFAIMQMTKISTRILSSYLQKSLNYHTENNTGFMSKDIIEQSDIFTNQVLLAITSLISDGLALLALVFFLVVIDPFASFIIIFVMGGGVSLLTTLTKAKITNYGKLTDYVNAKRFSFIISTLQAIKEIKAYAKENEFVNTYAQISNEMSSVYSRLSILQQLPSFIFQTVAPCVVIILSLYYVFIDENLTEIIPKLIIFSVVGFRLIPYLTKFINSLTSIRQNSIVIDNIYNLLVESKVYENSTLITDYQINKIPTIEFIEVNYAYKDSKINILKNISLKIQPNSFVGLVGESGAGKTTFVDLLLGFYSPVKGKILLNGISISKLDRYTIAKIFGYVHQSPILLDASIMENIAFGVSKEQIDHAKVINTIQKVHLESFLNRTDKKISDRVGERGVLLSGGQRQRIGIARALYVEPKILVLDESTNSLDGATENEILNTIINLKKDSTIIAVAHSKAILSRCDRVLMLKDGRVVADGTYLELLDNSDVFRALMAQKKLV